MRKKEIILRKGLFHSRILFLVIFAAILFCGTAISESSDTTVGERADDSVAVPPLVVLYELLPGSDFYSGCLGPCACPVLNIGEITGTFELRPLTPTSLFDRYSVTNIRWIVTDPTGKIIHKIRGNGIYEIGGEVARMQQMTLFLRIDGKKPVTFESGLVAEQSQLWDISIQIAHRRNTCYGFWMTIEASPKH